MTTDRPSQPAGPETGDDMSAVKQALIAVREMRAELTAVEHAQHEPIAIVGLGCRFPGGDGPEEFWGLLTAGEHAITPPPLARWDLDDLAEHPLYQFEDHQVDAARHGGFITDVDQFDPELFGIAPRECASLDPQQRILLEVTHDAFEDAGLPLSALRGTDVGTFIGIGTQEYGASLIGTYTDAHIGTGVALNAAAGRINHAFGFTGPAIAMDTACSSSLVAIHLAVKSLRSRECSAAVAGGVNLMLTPMGYVAMLAVNALSPTGRCRTFDAAADGYVRGEGAGVVVLKRLSDAQAANDRIHAVIRGSAVNHDGPSTGLTVPNQRSQEQVIRAALEDARLPADRVSYVEAHGTGTALGDPIEVRAISSVYGSAGRDRLGIGAVKTNIGHLEHAAGVAAVIKLVLALESGSLPASLAFETPNPLIDWEQIPIDVVTDHRSWTGDGSLVGAVSGFGFTGTNAHLIIEQAPATTPPATQGAAAAPFVLTARSEEALREAARRHARFLDERPEGLELIDVIHTAGARRSHHAHRLAVPAATTHDLAVALRGYARGDLVDGTVHGVATGSASRPAFVFTGQGAQFPGMASELYRDHERARAVIDECSELVGDRLSRPLVELLTDASVPSAELADTANAQPALFTLEVALARLWESWGVTPSHVAGHSVGGLAAACVADVFSLADGLALVTERGRLMSELPRIGAMASIHASANRVAGAIEAAGCHDDVTIAAYNAPRNVTISGTTEGVELVTRRLVADGVHAIELDVSHAFHSRLIEPMVADFARMAGEVTFRPPECWVVSDVSGDVAGSEVRTSRYWADQVLAPVRFDRCGSTLAEAGVGPIIEIGPRPALLGLLRQSFDELGHRPPAMLPSAQVGEAQAATLCRAVGQLFAAGVELDWASLTGGSRPPVDLPHYPFQRRSFWFKDTTRFALGDTGGVGSHFLECTGDELLGNENLSPSPERRFERSFEGRAGESDLMQLVAMAVRATEIADCQGATIELAAPLPVGTTEVLTTVTPTSEGADLDIATLGSDGWLHHASGALETTVHGRPPHGPPDGGAEGPEAESVAPVSGLGDAATLGAVVERVLDARNASEHDRAFRPHRASFTLTTSATPTTLYAAVYGAGDDVRIGLRWLDDEGGPVATALLDCVPDLPPLVESWVHRIGWDIATVDSRRRSLASTGWLVVGREPLLDDALTEHTTAPVWHVAPGTETSIDVDRRRLILSSPGVEGADAGWDQVADDFSESDLEVVIRIDRGPRDPILDATFLLESLQAIRSLPVSKLWLLTEGSQPVGSEPVDPFGSLVWSMIGTLAAELGHWDIHRVDLAADAEVEQLVDVLGLTQPLPMAAVRTDGVHTPTLERLPTRTAPATRLDPTRTHLITGGTGSLGLDLAAWLVDKGATSVVVAGRRDPTADELLRLDDLCSESVEVTFRLADVVDQTAVSALVTELGGAVKPLGGVFHLAGVSDDDLLEFQTAARLQGVMGPKVTGTRNLHEATLDVDLQHFVCFSSASAVLGTPGLSTYAAANAYQDGVCRHRAALGLPALSINWGPWAGQGMATSLTGESWETMGVALIPRSVGFELLGRFLAGGEPVVSVLTLDAARLPQRFAAAPARSGIAHEVSEGLRAALASLPTRDPAERPVLIADYLQEVTSITLGAPAGSSLPGTQSLFEAGLDSLMALELRNRVERELGATVDLARFLENPCLDHMTGLLADQFDAGLTAAALPAVKATTAAMLSDIVTAVDDLSDAEVDALLASLDADTSES